MFLRTSLRPRVAGRRAIRDLFLNSRPPPLLTMFLHFCYVMMLKHLSFVNFKVFIPFACGLIITSLFFSGKGRNRLMWLGEVILVLDFEHLINFWPSISRPRATFLKTNSILLLDISCTLFYCSLVLLALFSHT